MEEKNYQKKFNSLHKKYLKNNKKMKFLEKTKNTNSPEYREILNDQNNLLVKFQNLQSQVTNSNYEKQNNLEVLSSEVIQIQTDIKNLKKKEKELQENSDSAKGLNEQTYYIVETSFYYLVGKICILFFLLYLIYININTNELTNIIQNNLSSSSNNNLKNKSKIKNKNSNNKKTNNTTDKKYNINYNSNLNNNVNN